MTFQDKVEEFHRAFGLPTETSIQKFIPSETVKLRVDLLEEEFEEYLEAVATNNIIEIADALGDIVYIAFGTALTYGIDLDAVLDEIHKSNMSKLGTDGKPIYREDGKVLKGPNYRKPDIAAVLLERNV